MKKYIILLVLSAVCLSAQAEIRSYSAGPVWNNEDARVKCPAVCSSHHGQWNGAWRTVVEGQNSTCDCIKHNWGGYEHNPPRRVYVSVRQCQVKVFSPGPIWNNDDANYKCPQICGDHAARWTGRWWTVIQGQKSVCQCRRCFIG